MTEEMKEKIAVDAFNILMESELNTEPLRDYARKINVPVSYVLFIFNKWIHRTEAPCPSKEQLDKYNELVLKKNSNKNEKRAKLMFDEYLRGELSKETLERISTEYNLSEQIVRKWITKYVNGEFKDIGIAPTNAEVLKYNELYAPQAQAAQEERERKNAAIAKDCYDTYLSSDFDEQVLAMLATKYGVTIKTIISRVRNYNYMTYEKYGYFPSLEEHKKYEMFVKRKIQGYHDVKSDNFKSNRAPIAADAFNIYLSSGLSLDIIPMLAAKHNVTEGIIKTEIRKYRNGEYAAYGYAPSEEEKQKYEYLFSGRLPRRDYVIPSPKVADLKEGYEILLANNLNRAALIPLAKKMKISVATLDGRIANYRKRIIEPKPTIEQELRYVAMAHRLDVKIIEAMLNSNDEDFAKLIEKEGKSNLLAYLEKLEKAKNSLIASRIVELREKVSNFNNTKIVDNPELKTYDLNAQKCIDAMMEYIEGPCYSPLSVFKHYTEDPSSFEAYLKRLVQRDEKTASIYPLYEKVKNEKLAKYQELLLRINQNIIDKQKKQQKYDIINLCFDIDTTINDFATMMRSIRTSGIDAFSPVYSILEPMIKKSGITVLKSELSNEQVAKLKYNYNGVELTAELKNNIISYLNAHNIRVMTYTIILAFEKYVRGEITIVPEFHI